MRNQLIVLFLISCLASFADDDLKIMDNLVITATFSDFRNDHFHTGIDVSGKGQNLYSINDSEVIFYNNTRKGGIRYGNGNFVILESRDHKFRYNYSHMKDYSINKDLTGYGKGELIGISGSSGFSSGDHLHFEIELLAENRLANPLKYIKIKDTIKPIIQDIYIMNDAEKKSLLQFKNYQVKKNSRLFIQCFDRIDNSKYNVAPYKITLFIDGEEKKSICFDYLDKINQNFYVNKVLKFEDIYVNKTEFDFFLLNLNLIPGVCGLKIEIEDFNGNKQEFKTPIKIIL